MMGLDEDRKGRDAVANATSTADRASGLGAAAPFVVGAAVGLGVAIALVATRRSSANARPTEADKRAALAAYLREHLTGSDAALQVVTRLRRTHAGTEEGRLFATLSEEFSEERKAVRELLATLDVSAASPKRLAAQVSGGLLTLMAGGAPGDLSLFRTLEALAVGVQGKRCMWRALQSLGLTHPGDEGRSLADFEAMALRQWEAIDRHRRSLAPATFATPVPQDTALSQRGADAPAGTPGQTSPDARTRTQGH
jgi:hypothetical protein